MKFKEKIAPTYDNLVRLERFVLSIETLNSKEKNICIILLTEIVDNIISHSTPPVWSKISVQLTKKESIKIKIGFISKKFKDFAKENSNTQIKNTKMVFNTRLNRYSGFGLKMCNNMSKSIVYHIGLLKNLILVII